MSTVELTTEFQSSCLQGYVENASYADLVHIFGEPPSDGDGYKVDAEWNFLIDGHYATIYNYKSGPNYLGEEGTPIASLYDDDWHIGGNEKVVRDLVNQYIEAHRPDSVKSGGIDVRELDEDFPNLGGASKCEYKALEYTIGYLGTTDEDLTELAAEGWRVHFVTGAAHTVVYTLIRWV